jgi:hypothetical protein
LSEIAKLKATVDALDFKHKSELDEARNSSCVQKDIDLNILRERLGLEECRAEMYRKDFYELELEAKKLYDDLMSIIQEDRQRFETLEQMVRKVQNARINEAEEYNAKLRSIKLTISQINEHYTTSMLNKIDFSARESLWLVTQLQRMRQEKRMILDRYILHLNYIQQSLDVTLIYLTVPHY